MLLTICLFPGMKDAASANADMTLADLGLDSLMGVEIKQTLERDFDHNLEMKDIRLLTFAKLKELASGTDSEKSSATESAPGNAKDVMNTPIMSANHDIPLRFDIDCLMPKETLVPMNSSSSAESPLFIIHPVEGKFCY